MLWEIVNKESDIEAVFENNSPSLESLLIADDLYEKARENYEPLINFITKDEVFDKIIGYITQVHDEKSFNKEQYKFSNNSSELLKSTDSTSKKLIESKTCEKNDTKYFPYLDQLLDYFSRDKKLNTLSASLVCRVLIHSISFSSENSNYIVMNRLSSNPNFVQNIFRHTNCGAITDFLVYMTSIDDSCLHVPLRSIFNDTFFKSLINFLSPVHDPEYYESIAYLFDSISSNSRKKLSEYYSDDSVNYNPEEMMFYQINLEILESEEMINELFTRLTAYYEAEKYDPSVDVETFKRNRTYLAPNILKIITSFLNKSVIGIPPLHCSNSPKDSEPMVDSNERSNRPPMDPRVMYQNLASIRIINALIRHLPNLVKILSSIDEEAVEEGVEYLNGRVFGYSRIAICKIFEIITSIGVDRKTVEAISLTKVDKKPVHDENSQTQDSTMSNGSPMQVNEDESEVSEKNFNFRIDKAMLQLLDAIKEFAFLPLLAKFVQAYPMNTFLIESFTNIIQNMLVHYGYPIIFPITELDQGTEDFQELINKVFQPNPALNKNNNKTLDEELKKRKVALMENTEHNTSILSYLLNELNLCHWLRDLNPVYAFNQPNESSMPISQEESFSAKSLSKPRPGYSGHIWKIANFLLTIQEYYKGKFESDPFVNAFKTKEEFEDWTSFVNLCLTRINEENLIEKPSNKVEDTNRTGFSIEDIKNILKFQSQSPHIRLNNLIKNLNPQSFNSYSNQDDDTLHMPDSYQNPSSGNNSASPAPINETFEWAMKPILNSSDAGRTSECSNDSDSSNDDDDDEEISEDSDSDEEDRSTPHAPRVISQKKNKTNTLADCAKEKEAVAFGDTTPSNELSIPPSPATNDTWPILQTDDSNSRSNDVKEQQENNEDWADFSGSNTK